MQSISIIIPTYNQSLYLPICLDSVWFQDWPEIEIIIVNDGSTDNTKDTLARYVSAIRNDRVSYASDYSDDSGVVERSFHLRYPAEGRALNIIDHKENKGLGATINSGIRAAAGDYCTFIASDDMLLPSAMSELAALLNQGYDFAYADMHIIDDCGRILRRFSLPDYTFENAFCHWYLCGVCKLYRRELHDLIGYYDEEIKPQDHEMFLRFAINGARFVHVPKVLANVRIHNEEREVINHSPANWSRLYEESAVLVQKARRWLKSQG